MTEQEVEIVNRLGLHARAAARLVTLAQRFQSDVRLVHGTREANGKSIMGVLKLGATRGSRIRIRAEGPDEGEAVAALAALVGDRFGEDQ